MAATATRMIRVSCNVKTLIQQRANASGLSVSEWVRQVVSTRILDALTQGHQ